VPDCYSVRPESASVRLRPHLKKRVEPTSGWFLRCNYFRREVVRQMYAYRTEEVAAG